MYFKYRVSSMMAWWKNKRGFCHLPGRVGLLLILFVGLEFSMEKIKKVRDGPRIPALIHVGVSTSSSVSPPAFAPGWDLIHATSSPPSSPCPFLPWLMKTLMDLGRLDKPGTNDIIGMVIMEEFIPPSLLTVGGGPGD